MKKGWKILLISLGSLLGLVIVVAAVALWLVFTPSQLTKIVNRVAANYVLAETHFDRVDLTLFKTFPDAGLKIDNVYIVNPMDGAPNDTVARIGSLTLGVDVKAFLKENKVIVHQVLVDDVAANLYMDKEGKGNYDGALSETYQITARNDTLTSAGDSKTYEGTFDGAGHTITIALVRTADYAGLFNRLSGTPAKQSIPFSLRASIKNSGLIIFQIDN